ncbi:MAG: high frequency lysogenization protein [Oceanicoccus sp.]|jgi:high frequency lysogenization protein
MSSNNNSQSLSDNSIGAQTIALAGVMQSAYLVDQIARSGHAPIESFNPSINSLFAFDADNAGDVYGGLQGVKLGLQVLTDVLNGKNKQQYRSIIRYSLGMLFLQKKLSAKPELLTIIRNRLDHAAIKAEHFSDDTPNATANIASIYQDTLSTFKFRIQVNGSLQQLQNANNADNIRALLLAGIRGAVMWRQTGGRRWQLFFHRQKILRMAQQLLAEIE